MLYAGVEFDKRYRQHFITKYIYLFFDFKRSDGCILHLLLCYTICILILHYIQVNYDKDT